MSKTFPSLFISHGSPMMAVRDDAARRFLCTLGQEIGTPTAVAVISAHWETDGVRVSSASTPETIHDFGGFPRELYEMRYPARGATVLARRIVERLKKAGLSATEDPGRGLDHGAWIPMMLMYPGADIPVFQISIDPEAGPEHHLRLGQALREFRDEGVLILSSGSMTHNLGELRRGAPDAPVFPWVEEFVDWLVARIADNDIDALLNYRDQAPYAVRNHPSDEHFLPIFSAIGAGVGTVGKRLHSSYSLGGLALDAYAFD
jgi:4,5-DOPA dioxygenase extradiol